MAFRQVSKTTNNNRNNNNDNDNKQIKEDKSVYNIHVKNMTHMNGLAGTFKDLPTKAELSKSTRLNKTTTIKPLKTIMPLDCYITERLYSKLCKTYPQFYFVYSNKIKSSPHQTNRCFRRLDEAIICNRNSNNFIIDIGGNPQRHSDFGRSGVFSLCPVTCVRDDLRDKNWERKWLQPDGMGRKFCRHRLQDFAADGDAAPPVPSVNGSVAIEVDEEEKYHQPADCTCWKARYAAVRQRTPTANLVGMMIHSDYFITPKDVAVWMEKSGAQCVYSVHHLFNTDGGVHKQGDAHYRYNRARNELLYQIPGENQFKHGVELSWQKNGSIKYNQQYLNWTTIATTEISETIRIQFSKYQLHAATEDLAEVYKRTHDRKTREKELEELRKACETDAAHKLCSYRSRSYTVQMATSIVKGSQHLTTDDMRAAVKAAYASNTKDVIGDILNHNSQVDLDAIQNETLKRDGYIEVYDHLCRVISSSTQTLSGMLALLKRASKQISLVDRIKLKARILTSWFSDVLKNIWADIWYILFVTMVSTICLYWTPTSWLMAGLATIFAIRLFGFWMMPLTFLQIVYGEVLGSPINYGQQVDFKEVFVALLLLMLFLRTCFGTRRHQLRNRVKSITATSGAVLYGLCYAYYLDEIELIPEAQYTKMPKHCTNCKLYKEVSYQYGPRIKGYHPVITQPSLCDCNRQLAIKWRVMRKRENKPDAGTMQEIGTWLRNWIHVIIPVTKERVMFKQEWINTIKSTKRQNMLDAEYRFVHTSIKSMFKEKWAKIKAFLKTENLMQNKPKAPRFIQGRHDEYNYQWGNFIYTASVILKKCWSIFPSEYSDWAYIKTYSPITYFSGYSKDKGGRWFDQSLEYVNQFAGETVVYCSDFSMYDMTIRKGLLDLEYEMIRHMVEPDSACESILEQSYATSGHIGKFAYKIKDLMYGFRKSGDQDTSLGNSLITGVTLLWMWCKLFNCTPEEVKDMPFRLVVLGDDTCLITKRFYATKLKASGLHAKLGLKVKHEITTPAKAEFCSCWFIPCSIGYMMTPKPTRVLGKTFYGYKKFGKRKALGYAKGIAQGFLPDYGHLPFMRTIMKRVMGLTYDVKAYRTKEDIWKSKNLSIHSAVMARATDRTWQWCYEVYGVTKPEFEDLEEMIDTEMNSVICDLEHPVLTTMFEVDNGFGVLSMPNSITAIQ